MNLVISQGEVNSNALRHIKGDFVIGGSKAHVEHLIQELARASLEVTRACSDQTTNWTAWLEICSARPLTA